MRSRELYADATALAEPAEDRALSADVFVLEWAVATEPQVEVPPAPERWRNEALAGGFES